MDIRHTRNIYNSIFRHLNSLLVSGSLITGSAGTLTFLDAYPSEDQLKRLVPFLEYDSSDSNMIALPVITMETSSFRETGSQLGSQQKDRKSPIILSVFAETDLQADYLADFVVSGLTKHNMRLYDFNQDYSSPPDDGSILVDDGLAAFFHYFQSANQIFKNTIDIVFTVSTTN